MSTLKEILGKVSRKELSCEEAEKLLQLSAVEEIGNLARVDVNREIRKGFPEVILAEGKPTCSLIEVARGMLSAKGRVIISRCRDDQVESLRTYFEGKAEFRFEKDAKIVVLRKKGFVVQPTGGRVGILSAGTSDVPVAEEVRIIVEEMGCAVLHAYDVGVAGIHRLTEPLKRMVAADVDVIVVVAGREGALASVVAGLVDVPVIAVPTSNSYGFGGKGVGTLIAMLQSCSLGLTVVNIDNGIGAGAAATLIANRVARFRAC